MCIRDRYWIPIFNYLENDIDVYNGKLWVDDAGIWVDVKGKYGNVCLLYTSPKADGRSIVKELGKMTP